MIKRQIVSQNQYWPCCDLSNGSIGQPKSQESRLCGNRPACVIKLVGALNYLLKLGSKLAKFRLFEVSKIAHLSQYVRRRNHILKLVNETAKHPKVTDRIFSRPIKFRNSRFISAPDQEQDEQIGIYQQPVTAMLLEKALSLRHAAPASSRIFIDRTSPESAFTLNVLYSRLANPNGCAEGMLRVINQCLGF